MPRHRIPFEGGKTSHLKVVRYDMSIVTGREEKRDDETKPII